MREAIECALDKANKQSKDLAGKVAGTERRARTIRQDLAERTGLKVEAASFLIRRAFDEKVLDQYQLLQLEAIIRLSHSKTVYVTPDLWSRGVKGALFFSEYLEGEILSAISRAAPRLRTATYDSISLAVEDVLERARERAHEAGALRAYADYLDRHIPRTSKEEQLLQARALRWARAKLGDEAPVTAGEHEARWHQLFSEDELR